MHFDAADEPSRNENETRCGQSRASWVKQGMSLQCREPSRNKACNWKRNQERRKKFRRQSVLQGVSGQYGSIQQPCRCAITLYSDFRAAGDKLDCSDIARAAARPP